jgi:hypothetical protein
MNGWIGVDLDGTLARYDGWKGPEHIGEPIPAMLERVKTWLFLHKDVRIFTARVSSNNPEKDISIKVIRKWCKEHIGQELPITAEKDYGMIELWDDRCTQVIKNDGTALIEILYTIKSAVNGGIPMYSKYSTLSGLRLYIIELLENIE